MTTIGQKLKEAREDQRLTIEKVFEATRIRMQYLQALEEDDLSLMPSPVQARGYLRNYAEFLGLDVAKLLDEMREANAQTPADVVFGPADAEVADVPETGELAAAEEAAPVDDTTPLIKPKPARRKKTDSQPVDDSATTPRRRGRRKTEIELEPVTPVVPVEDIQPEGVADPIVLEEPAVIEPAPVVEETQAARIEIPALPEPSLESDINDSLWQTWLNRVTSVLAARNKRNTLVPKVEIVPELESEPAILRAETSQENIEEQNLSSESSIQIFKEIGRELSARREMLSLHLEEVERNTHVKAHYLEALEKGAMDDLPSTVQTRGMLSNYATFLDLDVDALLLRFADALQARHRERNPLKLARKPGQPIIANLPPMRSFIAGDLIFGIGIVILLVGFSIWGVSWVLNIQSQREVQPNAPSISEILLASPDPSSFTETPTFVPIESFPGEPTVTVVIPTLNANVNVQVNLIAVERTYMRVIADGEQVFAGRVTPGTAYPFEAVEQIEVLVGSGAAIRIVYNGRDMGLLGSFGQVVNNIYMPEEIITPTGLPTPTETVTPTPTNTPPPTPTSRFTATPVITSTPVP